LSTWQWIQAWADEHPLIVNVLVGFVVTYVLASVKSWPPPKHPVALRLWRVFVQTLFLSWDRWGGRFRLPFVDPIDEPEKLEPKDESK
jgi:hypothetical protein